MRPRHCLFVLALLSMMTVLLLPCEVQSRPGPGRQEAEVKQESNDGGVSEVSAPPLVVPTPLPLAGRDSIYDAAYKDSYTILHEFNSCSQFFGGSVAAVRVLNELAGHLETRLMPDRAGITMSGERTIVKDHATGVSYRLFQKAVINSNGPFYRQKALGGESSLPRIGSFMPNTREARVLILLHELAHMMKGQDGNWLIPDDGDSIDQSAQNTQVVESKCSKQIKGIRSETARAKSSARQKPETEAALKDGLVGPQP